MNIAAELAVLRKEVAQLEEELTELRRFCTIGESDAGPGQKVLTLRCSGVFLYNRLTGSVAGHADDRPGWSMEMADEKHPPKKQRRDRKEHREDKIDARTFAG